MSESSDKLLRRFTLLKTLDFYIELSAYYRTHSDNFFYTKSSLYKLDQENGKVNIT